MITAITAIAPILKGIVISILWEGVKGYLVTAIKDAEKLTELKGAERREVALKGFEVLHIKYEGKEPSADMKRKAAQQVSIVHDDLERTQTL